MDPSSITSSQLVVKAPTTLDRIPDDVQLAIIKFIQSWKRSEGSKEEREKGRRARDSALRSMALSCQTLLSIYQRELLLDVTLNMGSFLDFYLYLKRSPDSGKLVRSITFTGRDVDLTREELTALSKELFRTCTDQGISSREVEPIKSLVEAAYQLLPNIQTLIVQRPQFKFPLQTKLANARIAPLPFLSHSLKKLLIPMWNDFRYDLRVKNVVWILVFCTGLRFACLSCVFDQDDFKYLTDHSDAISGLSKVRKLSLGLNFKSIEQIKRYWDREVGKQWIGGNRKTEALFNLLKVTKNLQCLEICNLSSSSDSDSETSVRSDCLSALKSSFKSLEYLRFIGVDPHHDGEYKVNLPGFVELKVISMDALVVLYLARNSEFTLPPCLKILCIPYYFGAPTVLEDEELALSFKVRSFPELEAVIVPSRSLLRDGSVSKSEDYKRRWLEGRRELEKAEVFQSGKVELRLVEPGESIGESSETDFMSTLRWISPP